MNHHAAPLSTASAAEPDFEAITAIRRALLPMLEPVSPTTADANDALSLIQTSAAGSLALPPSSSLVAPSAVQCTYLDYMGCTPFVDCAELARHLAVSTDSDGRSSTDRADILSSILALQPSAIANSQLFGSATGSGRPSLPFGNPHSTHPSGLKSGAVIKELRQRTVAYVCDDGSSVVDSSSPSTPSAIGVGPSRDDDEYICVLTSGTTAGCRLVSELLGRSSGGGGCAFIAHRLSHNSVLGMRGPLGVRGLGGVGGEDKQQRTSSFYGTFISRDELRSNFADLKTKRLCLTDDDGVSGDAPPLCVVAFPAECNLSGTVLDVKDTAAMIRSAFVEVFGSPSSPSPNGHAPPPRLLIFCDGAAAVGKHPIGLRGSGVDYFAFSYYKAFGGPTGLGGLLVSKQQCCGWEGRHNGGLTQSASPAVDLLLKGKSAQRGGYFGGGSVAFVLPNTSSHGIKGAPMDESTTGRKLAPSFKCPISPLVGDGAVAVTGIPSYLSSASALPPQPSLADDETLCQGLEDGTPHFLGAAAALQWLRLVALFPHVLSPAAVGQRIAALRAAAADRMSRLVICGSRYGSAEVTQCGSGPLKKPQQRRCGVEVIAPLSATAAARDGSHLPRIAVGSSVAFRVLTHSGTVEAHSVCETLLQTNALHKVALRSGGFCNPGACQTFLGVTEDDIKETFGISSSDGDVDTWPTGSLASAGGEEIGGTVPAGGAVGSRQKSQCFDANDVSPSGKALGCLRASFGLYSTMADVDRLVAALKAMGMEESCADDADGSEGAAKESTTDPSAPEACAAKAKAPRVSTACEDEQSTPPADYRLHSLYVYPIKGCKPIVPQRSWPLVRSGLLYDRQWCLVAAGGQGRALVPKECIGLAGLEPSVVVEVPSQEGEGGPTASSLIPLDALGSEHSAAVCGRRFLRIYLPRTAVAVTIDIDDGGSGEPAGAHVDESLVAVRRHTVEASRVSSAAANAALSKELGLAVELVRAGAGEKKKKDTADGSGGNDKKEATASTTAPAAGSTVGTKLSNFTNSGELLLITRESHAHIMASIANPSEKAHVTLLSYRPNIVVERDQNERVDGRGKGGNGRSGAYAELFWDSVGIDVSGEGAHDANRRRVALTKREVCLRCSQVGVDTSKQQILLQPLAAIRSTCQALTSQLSDEALVAMGATRNSIAFGSIFAPTGVGVVSAAQPLTMDQFGVSDSVLLCIGSQVVPLASSHSFAN